MASLPPKQAPFNMIEVLQGPPTQPIYYRISVGSSVKYLMGPKPLSGLPDGSGEHLGFDTVPAGDWDVGNLVVGADGKFALVSTEKRRFPDLTPAWHGSRIDLLELGDPVEAREDYELQLRVHVPSDPYPGAANLEADTVLAFWNIDLEGVDSYALAQESRIYSLLQHKSIAPRFLAHLTDNHDRVIGYVLESVPARNAGTDDLDLCRKALQDLHSLRILHGNLSRGAFLIREDIPVAQLQFFHQSREAADQTLLDEEMSKLEEVLREPLPKPGGGDVSDELAAIQTRDGYIHPFLFWQLKHDGRISISQDDHRSLLAELGEKDWHYTRHDVEDTAKRLRENGGHLP
ncbi:hypothetical protein GGS23DRAFT_581431 [Durotheca rogersii]|uniref:uncharacterized protein n=1 Tax=Durotheca rogersii TaxID=419775 RepID=UPI00221E919D|nr:uncharacterized protein GGS23DRAFT_581431 [Durotheca rogersii]KAI5860445.1 hypothetical protein GGS23DRAFT_581431 [Durotheca rogersii]